MMSELRGKKGLAVVFGGLIIMLVGNGVFAAGVGGKVSEGPNRLRYVPLQEGAGNVSGDIHDEGTIARVYGLSFYGNTNVGGVRAIESDSSDKLDLSKIQEIVIVNPSYVSKRHCDQVFVQVNVLMKGGQLVPDLLVPENVVVCGIEQGTNIEKAWYLKDLDRIINIHDASMIEGEQKTVYSKEYYAQERRGRRVKALRNDVSPEVVEQPEPEGKKLTVPPAEPVGQESGEKESKTLLEALLGIIDAIIDLIKALFGALYRLLKS